MVKKLQQTAEKLAASSAGLLDSALASTVRESAQQIWLAGLGAFAKAQEEGGKVFEALVKEGAALQRRTQSAAGERIGDVSGRVSTLAGDVTAKAGQQWDKLETIFEQRTSRALARLGVPSSKDIEALVRRIDELSGQVAALSKPARTTRTRRTTAAKANGGTAKAPARRAAARKAA